MAPRNSGNESSNGTTSDLQTITQRVPLPDVLAERFTLTAWAESLVNGVPYEELDPDYLSRLLVMQTLTAASLEDVFVANGIRGLQDWVPNVPEASTGPILVDDIYVAKSDKDMGTPCYIIFGGVGLETGEKFKSTTGANQVQAQFLAALSFGMWPLKCEIKRIDRKDKGGRFLFWVSPVE